MLGIMSRMAPMMPQDEEDKDFSVCEAGLLVAMHEMMEALEKGDARAAARAFHAAFQMCEAAPHEEVEHDEDKPAYVPPSIE